MSSPNCPPVEMTILRICFRIASTNIRELCANFKKRVMTSLERSSWPLVKIAIFLNIGYFTAVQNEFRSLTRTSSKSSVNTFKEYCLCCKPIPPGRIRFEPLNFLSICPSAPRWQIINSKEESAAWTSLLSKASTTTKLWSMPSTNGSWEAQKGNHQKFSLIVPAPSVC